MSEAFDQFQARIRASERFHCEADIYWRTNRWAEDGRDMKAGPVNVTASGIGGRSTLLESVYRNNLADTVEGIERGIDAATAERYRSLYQSGKPCPPGQGRIYRR
ncbi:hypothetical protein [Bradyrhizobium elkanii]|uniref:hypothetical protein n=1 Tax=Bradyrhizobium elkanii TaxID=29448 RepID=UPI003514D052